MDVVREKLKLLPDEPGVYIMLDESSNVIYVGKARSLKNRVRQYFHNSPKPEKVMKMVEHVADFNYIITDSEIDALALENNLIKKYKPRYNILLKDDKTYPYIKADVGSDFPSFRVTRRISRDGARYFGPFMGGINCRDLLDVLQIAFKVKICRTPVDEKPRRECLNYHIGRCTGPCAHKVSKDDYAEQVRQAVSFLEGNYRQAQRLLEEKMAAAAEAENFELAMDYRDKSEMLEKLEARRLPALSVALDADIIAYVTNGLYSVVSVLMTRGGIMQGGTSYAMDDADLDSSDAISNFLMRYYAEKEIPSEIITDPCEGELLRQYFRDTFGKSVEITNPKQGVKSRLLDMAHKNAAEYLDKSVDRIRHRDDMTVNACARLKEILGLRNYPRRMECFDVSNVSGVDKVGSMVVFVDGEADKSSYRRFRIKTVEGADDFASMREMLERRLSKLGTADEEKFPRPDLIIIDGGKGQLSAVEEIFSGLGIDGIDLVSLAKREEEVFVPGREESIKIPHDDYCLKMLQRIRDEAHRFAVTYFRNLHSKRNLASVLDDIDGIGKRKQEALMERFSTIDSIMSASEDELAETPGIGKELARSIKKYFEESI